MAIGSMFGELNKAILGNVLNNRPDTSVEGQPMRAMDNINPMLRGAAQGFGAAMGADPATLQTSQEAKMTQEAADKAKEEARVLSHRESVIKRAEDMGLTAVAEGLRAGGTIKEYLPQILTAQEEKFKTHEATIAEARKAKAAERKHAMDVELSDRKFEQSISMLDAEDQISARAENRRKNNDRKFVDIEGDTWVVDGHGNKLYRSSMTQEAWKRSEDKKENEIAAGVKRLDDLANAAEKQKAIKGNIADVKNKVYQMGSADSPGETGLMAKGQSYIPGTAAYDADKALTSLKAKLGLGKMEELKAQSSTGSTGFGALSAPELELLLSSLASLDIGMSNDAFNDAMAVVEQYADDVIDEWDRLGDDREIPENYRSPWAEQNKAKEDAPSAGKNTARRFGGK